MAGVRITLQQLGGNLMRRHRLSNSAPGVLFFFLVLPLAALGADNSPTAPPDQLGNVNFPTSCTAQVQPPVRHRPLGKSHGSFLPAMGIPQRQDAESWPQRDRGSAKATFGQSTGTRLHHRRGCVLPEEIKND